MMSFFCKQWTRISYKLGVCIIHVKWWGFYTAVIPQWRGKISHTPITDVFWNLIIGQDRLGNCLVKTHPQISVLIQQMSSSWSHWITQTCSLPIICSQEISAYDSHSGDHLSEWLSPRKLYVTVLEAKMNPVSLSSITKYCGSKVACCIC